MSPAISTDHEKWAKLRDAVRAEMPNAVIPEPDRWRNLDDEALWSIVVGQVAVIGRSEPWERLAPRLAEKGITYGRLVSELENSPTTEIASRFHRAFSDAGVRYVGRSADGSGKATACARNFRRVRAFGGPREFVAVVSRIVGDDERIEFVIDVLSHVNLKGARDLLMELGMHRNSIALDARVMSVLRAAGLSESESAPSKAEVYREIEMAIISNVADPFGLEPVVVDRTMYQRQKEIVTALSSGR